MKSILIILKYFLLSRSADTEAPDQKTRFIRKKKNKKKKKRKKPLHNGTDQSLANISNESIEDKTESTEEGKPISLISCSSDHCEKKFTSESALKYHVTFAHEKIKRPAPEVIPAKSVTRDRNVSNNGVMAPHETIDDPGSKQDTNGSSEDTNSLSQSAGEQRREGSNSSNISSKDKEKMRTKAFPSTQNIRPILPAQGPQIPGTQLKPIQPKPAILPPPHKSLNLDTLKKPLLNKSPVNNSSVKCEPGIVTSDNGGPGAAMDLSHGGKTSHNGEAGQERKPLLAELKREVKPEPALVTPPKARTPIISIKSEFNTGIVNKSLSDPTDRDELEVLKHISKAPGNPVAAPFPAHSEYLNHPAAAAALGLMSSPLGPGLGLPGYLGLHGPPSSTASHLLPGLMGLPGVGPPPGHPAHPGTASSLSPFGASLESLARAAEERARTFGGGFSPAALPGVPGALHSPSAALPGGSPSLGRPGPGPPGAPPPVPGVPGAPPTSESGDAPLLRHEHMHTHLHYITSPTHASQ